jgi:hypothetical protein
MDGAVRLARALTTHARHVLAEIGTDQQTATLRYVLRRACEISPSSSLRDLHLATRDRPGLEKMEDLHPVVDALAVRGCLRLVEQKRTGPGRPPSPLVELHPAIEHQNPETPAQNPQNPAITALGGNTVGFVRVNPALASEIVEL